MCIRDSRDAGQPDVSAGIHHQRRGLVLVWQQLSQPLGDEVDEASLAERADVDDGRCAEGQDGVPPGQEVAPALGAGRAPWSRREYAGS